MAPKERTFLTTRQVMERLGVSRQTVVNLVKKGKLKQYASELGGPRSERVFYDLEEVDSLRDIKPRK